MKKLWIVDALRGAIQDLLQRRQLAEIIESKAETILTLVLKNITDRQPIGHAEEIYKKKFGEPHTVSRRLGHTPIAEGWKTRTEKLEKGISLQVRNISQHVLAVVHGTPAHPEDTAYPHFMYYWYGAPHRWGPQDETAGPRKRYHVEHPGATENPFITEAAKASRPEMRRHVGDSMVEFIKLNLQGFKEVKSEK